jgi:hypothetical protein
MATRRLALGLGYNSEQKIALENQSNFLVAIRRDFETF